jgi:hypothetical protein
MVPIKAIATLYFVLQAFTNLMAEEQTTYGSQQISMPSELSLGFLGAEASPVIVNPMADESRRVVIIDELGNKIREERIAEDQPFCNSTLAPMIYRCSFVAETYGVCYYLLRKN